METKSSSANTVSPPIPEAIGETIRTAVLSKVPMKGRMLSSLIQTLRASGYEPPDLETVIDDDELDGDLDKVLSGSRDVLEVLKH
ncbi:hypothetical protein FRC06_009761, partial [Ceratobasidium sp. 370]